MKREIHDWIIIGSFFACGLAGYWLTPDWSHPKKDDPVATHKDPAISVFTRSLGPAFILWVDAEGRTWKVVDEAFVPNEYPYLYYANTHEIERVKKVDGKTMYRLREITVLTTLKGGDRAVDPK